MVGHRHLIRVVRLLYYRIVVFLDLHASEKVLGLSNIPKGSSASF